MLNNLPFGNNKYLIEILFIFIFFSIILFAKFIVNQNIYDLILTQRKWKYQN
jgi:ABC-type bacteriocin/lantibiotic exporter with double-glycine peptidase domain